MANIPNPSPIVVPLVEEKIYDKQFCTRLEISAAPGREWTASFVGLPYNGVETLSRGAFVVELKDLGALASVDLELAQAMGAVLGVIGKYLVKCKIKDKRQVTVDNIKEILS